MIQQDVELLPLQTTVARTRVRVANTTWPYSHWLKRFSASLQRIYI